MNWISKDCTHFQANSLSRLNSISGLPHPFKGYGHLRKSQAMWSRVNPPHSIQSIAWMESVSFARAVKLKWHHMMSWGLLMFFVFVYSPKIDDAHTTNLGSFIGGIRWQDKDEVSHVWLNVRLATGVHLWKLILEVSWLSVCLRGGDCFGSPKLTMVRGIHLPIQSRRSATRWTDSTGLKHQSKPQQGSTYNIEMMVLSCRQPGKERGASTLAQPVARDDHCFLHPHLP